MPNMPSVRYNAMIYPSEAHCLDARDGYMNAYAAKDLEYKSKLKTWNIKVNLRQKLSVFPLILSQFLVYTLLTHNPGGT